MLRLQEAERGRVSRELHDGVGQSLTALKMQIERLVEEASKGGSPFYGRLQEIRAAADLSLQEVRHLSRLLRPPMLD